MAMGRLVVPTWPSWIRAGTSGAHTPSATPRPMARKIQRVRYRSRADSLLFVVFMVSFRLFW